MWMMIIIIMYARKCNSNAGNNDYDDVGGRKL